MNNQFINTLIIDDEEEAREGIRKLLEEDQQISIKAVCKNGVEAIQAINKFKPDLIFLDIQMPAVNGFEVLNSIPTQFLPVTIFVTAYDQYALQAFEHQALDYLLKPFTQSRFFTALSLAKERLIHQNKHANPQQVKKLLDDYGFKQQPEPLITEQNSIHMHRLIVKSMGKIYFLKYEEITYIEAQNVYVSIHIKDNKYLVRESLKRLESKLPTHLFIRIHKSTIVNLNFIKELEPFYNNEFIMKLYNGKTLKVSRSYTQSIKKLL